MSTYVISDVHAHNYEFDLFYRTLKKNDKVYVLGDVIDKGDNGIKILQTIIHDSRFHFCLGNHEYMMLEYLESLKADDIFAQRLAYAQWCDFNYGYRTLSYFEELSNEEQGEIITYLNNAALAFNISVNKKKFYLTHSYPQIDTNKKVICFKDYGLCDTTAGFVWKRVDYRWPVCLNNKTIIAGHTASIHYRKYEVLYDTDDIKEANYIDIDTGLAYNQDKSKLAVLKLNNLTITYYQKKPS